MTQTTNNTIKLSFAAIGQELENNIILPTEVDTHRGFIGWGDNNGYAEYLNSLYETVATLHSIIEGSSEFVVGDKIDIDDVAYAVKINDKGETIEDLVLNIARDYFKYGGFAIQVVRNLSGQVGSLYYVPLEKLRSDEKNEWFYYSKDWSKSYGRVKTLKYPKFDPNSQDPTSIYFYNNNKSNTYPTPKWSAAVIACEIERNVNEYHLNGILNGFSANYLISLNNGVPNDEQKLEIEEDINEKFSGAGNGGRIVIAFNDDKEHSAELHKLETEDVGEKYKSLIERTKSEIFCAFRATPNLFGIPTETTGFNSQEYAEAFKLYNRTTIRPAQKIIARAINFITGKEINITPFSLDEEENNVTE